MRQNSDYRDKPMTTQILREPQAMSMTPERLESNTTLQTQKVAPNKTEMRIDAECGENEEEEHHGGVDVASALVSDRQ